MRASICLEQSPCLLPCMFFTTAIENKRFKSHIISSGNYFMTKRPQVSFKTLAVGSIRWGKGSFTPGSCSCLPAPPQKRWVTLWVSLRGLLRSPEEGPLSEMPILFCTNGVMRKHAAQLSWLFLWKGRELSNLDQFSNPPQKTSICPRFPFIQCPSGKCS